MGRERELTQLGTLLRSRHTRVLTLVGPAGAGKTRLALEYARRRRAAGGVPVLVELAGLADGSDPAQAVATALGVGEQGGRTGAEAVTHALRGHQILLLLDNCEHIVDGCARLVAALLERCPGLRVLATSREALRVPGEVVVRVGELDTGRSDGPAASGAPDVFAASDAVRLFMDRATASAPGFEAVGEDAATIGEICRRLDGMPLAIELAARRTASLPLSAILSGLDDQLTLLTDGSRTGPARHLDLAAAVDWSHHLLTAPEKALLRRLSVLRGGFDVDAATAVAADGPGGTLPSRRILPLLLSLEAKSLLSRASPPGPISRSPSPRPVTAQEAGQNAGQEAVPVRFRQLEGVRAYARERLEEAGEAEQTWQRAVAWLAGLVSSEQDSVYADFMPGPALAEEENLAAAVAAAPDPVGTPGGPPPVLALALARIRFHQEHLSAALALLEAGPRWPDDRLQVARLALAARITTQQGDAAAAVRFGERAVALARRLGHLAPLAGALDARAGAQLMKGEFSLGVEDFRACAGALDRLQRPVDAAGARHHLAWALLQAGRPAEADTLLSGCLPVLREHVSPSVLAAALHTAGAVRLALADWSAAQELFAEVLNTVPAGGYEVLYPIEGLAAVAAAQGEYRRAVRLFTAAAQARARLESEMEPGWRDQIAPHQAAATAALPRAARTAATAAGRTLSWPALVAYARGEADYDPPQDGSPGSTGPLTARESTVAELVAQGLTNRQIGMRLNISPGTVATHLNRIRDKLSIRSRTQIALWLTEQHTAKS